MQLIFYFLILISTPSKEEVKKTSEFTQIMPAAYSMNEYLPLLKGKQVGIIANHTSMIGNTHLVDSLVSLGITIKRVFSPEHGFRGDADAGAHIKDGVDSSTGIEIASLYGSNRKPTEEMMKGIDVFIFDIQDVGARFYTYISTMHYCMEAASEKGIPFIVLDRPNPNGQYVDGPIRQEELKSFVGMHPIPIVHGMTVGELALMINDQGWLTNGEKCELKVVKVKNYKHSDHYSLPIKPSPNLPNDLSIALYPSICLFEGTVVSLGRGTLNPFQQLGLPEFKGKFDYSFTPKSIPGMATNPKHENTTCYGISFMGTTPKYELSLTHLIEFYQLYKGKDSFFISSFNRLAGTKELQEQIKAGMTEEQIKLTWQPGLNEFKKLRNTYLLYPN